MCANPLRSEIHYPESDGRPMAETDLHRDEMMYLIEALSERFRENPDVYVSGNLLLYYREGDPRSCVSPDTFVVKGVAKGRRRTYKLWEEGRVPCFVVEVTSRSTRGEDLREKRNLYQRLGVEEYFLHDPLEEYLKPPLQGFRLTEGLYQPISPEKDGSLFSRTTGLRLRLEGERLVLIDPATDEPLPGGAEALAAIRQEKARRLALEEEIARLRRELEERG